MIQFGAGGEPAIDMRMIKRMKPYSVGQLLHSIAKELAAEMAGEEPLVGIEEGFVDAARGDFNP